MAEVCRTCGAPLPEGRNAGICSRCSFGSALSLGAADSWASGSLEGYEIVHELGRGGMGVVWLARERSLDRLVALKLIAVADPRLQQRLLREGQSAARLRHPNIVAVHAMGGAGSSTFLAMEFVEGGNLDAYLNGKPIDPGKAALLASKLAGALEHAHEAGLLHRDVKPSNILIDPEGEPKLADFGLAAPLEGAGDLTAPGTVAGTPSYLAPEILGGAERARVESDIYGLGAVLYCCLTGRPPFVGASAAAVIAQVSGGEPLAPRLLQPGIPRDLETICLKCLEKSPERRYPSALLLQADLAAFLRGEPISARPVGAVGRLVRYCRRRPALSLATASAVVLLLTLAIGGPLMALRLQRSQGAALAARARAEKAEADTLERLRDSLLTRSRETRLAGGKGQRDEALAAATEAAQIRKGLDARNEAIAAMARPEVVMEREFPIKNDDNGILGIDLDDDRYALEAKPGQLELRRLSDNGLIQSLRGPPSKLWSLPVFSWDGRRLASRNEKGQEIVWSDASQDPVLVMEDRMYVLTGRFEGYGLPEAFSPDGRTMVSALPAGGVSFHSPDGKEFLRIATATPVTHLAFSPDGRWLAVGRGLRGSHGEVATLRVVDASSGKDVTTLPIEASYQTIAWSPGSDKLLVGSEELRMFAIPEGKSLCRISDPFAVKAFFGPGGTTLLSASDSGIVTLWDLGKARPLLMTELGYSHVTAVNRGGTRVAKAVGENSIRLFRLEMSKVSIALPIRSNLDRDNVLSVAVPVIDYSPDGRWLATAIWGWVQLRDASGAVVAVSPQGTLNNRCSVRFSRDGKSLLVSSSELGLVEVPLQNQGDGRPSLGKGIPLDSESGYCIADVSRDGERVLLTSDSHASCKVIRIDHGAPPVRWPLPGAAGASFVENDAEVLANSLKRDHGALIELRDAKTGELRRTLNYPHGAHVHASPDGKWVVFGYGDDESILLRTPGWTEGPKLPAEVQGRGSQLAISPDSNFIAFGVGDTVHLVRSSDGSEMAQLQSPQGGTYLPGLAFSPDGTHLALWWENGQLTLWDIAALRALLSARGMDW